MEEKMIQAYAALLACLPPGFQEAFAVEMVAVFARQMREAASHGHKRLLWTFMSELIALPGLWLIANQRERRVLEMDATRSGALPDDGSTGAAPWSTALAAGAPLALFLLLSFMRGRGDLLQGFPQWKDLDRLLWIYVLRVSVEPPMLFYLVILAGFLVAWVKGFPRWADTTLGWLATLLLFSAGALRPRDPYFWVSWAPFFLVLIAALLLSRSIAPLKALWRGWRQDWTRVSLALLALLEFIVWASFDEMPNPGGAKAFWETAALAVLAAGAVWVMRLGSKNARILAILASAALSVSLSVGATSYYWHNFPKSSGPVSDGTAMLWNGLLFLGVVIASLLAPALLSVKRSRRSS